MDVNEPQTSTDELRAGLAVLEEIGVGYTPLSGDEASGLHITDIAYWVTSGPSLSEVREALQARGHVVAGSAGVLVIGSGPVVFLWWAEQQVSRAKAVVLVELYEQGTFQNRAWQHGIPPVSDMLDDGLPLVPSELEPIVSTAVALLLDRVDNDAAEFELVNALHAEPAVIALAKRLVDNGA